MWPAYFRALDASELSRAQEACSRFIASINPQCVLDLASRYRANSPCSFFKPLIWGTNNVCFFVGFDDGEKWVIRLPFAPTLALGARDKLETEVAMMQLIAEKTPIPIPKLIAYSLNSNESDPLAAFLILEYVEGQQLTDGQLEMLSPDQETRLYTSLADIFLHLRRLRFPDIGRLTQVGHECQVTKKTTSLDINTQMLAGLGPSKIQEAHYEKNDGRLVSAMSYVHMLLNIAENAFRQDREKSDNQAWDKKAPSDFSLLRRYAENWVDPNRDSCPFVPVHGNLTPSSLIVNANMEVVAVLNWDWSRVVPRQFFLPPTWLTSLDAIKEEESADGQRSPSRFDRFLSIVRLRGQQILGDMRLADEWTAAKEDGSFQIANVLEGWTEMDWSEDWYRKTPAKRNEARPYLFNTPRHCLPFQDFVLGFSMQKFVVLSLIIGAGGLLVSLWRDSGVTQTL